MASLKQEVFVIVLLNNKHCYLTDMLITKGILNKSLVHCREVFAPAIVYRAAAIIACHNHPSGDPQPSPEDIAITKRIQEAGKIIGIPLIDHIVFGGDRYFSFAAEGILM
ncbi:MAG: JAB domain-containing protein [Desulfamplus sp.]|nr:JAB domain-containing protein [Desulfamplus sp.]